MTSNWTLYFCCWKRLKLKQEAIETCCEHVIQNTFKPIEIALKLLSLQVPQMSATAEAEGVNRYASWVLLGTKNSMAEIPEMG